MVNHEFIYFFNSAVMRSNQLFFLRPLLFIFCFISINKAAFGAIYYSKASGLNNLQSTATWGTNTDGSGSAPANFTTAGDNFYVQNGTTATIAGNWTVSGTVIVTSGVTFTIPETPTEYSLTGRVDVNNGSTLIIQSNLVPTLGSLGATSTVVYEENVENTPGSIQNLASGIYGNLTIRRTSPAKNFPSGLLRIVGNLILDNTTVRADASSTMFLTGNMTLNGTVNFNTNIKSNLTLNTSGNGDQTITGSASTTVIDFATFSSSKSAGSLTLTASPVSGLDIGGNMSMNYTGTAVFNTNGNAITVGGSYTLGGTGTKEVPGGTYNTLIVNIDGTGQLTGNAVINSELRFNISGGITNSTFYLNQYDLTMGSGSTITNVTATKHVTTRASNTNAIDGFLIREIPNGQTVSFPVGVNGENYTPMSITNNSTTTSFKVRAFNGVYTLGTSGSQQEHSHIIDKTWEITPVVASGSFDVDFTFQWNAANQAPDFDHLLGVKVIRFETDWADVSLPATPAGSDPYTITASGITSFSKFTVGDDAAALPVSFLSFTGKEENGLAMLKWTTGSETNNMGFEIEKSLDGNQFEKIGFVKGAGNSTQKLDYTFNDEQIYQNSYYRLKQIDFDGKFDYSTIIFVLSGKHDAHPYFVFPNPVQTELQLTYLLQENPDRAKFTQIELLDNKGVILLTGFNTVSELNLLINNRLATLPTGMYHLVISDNSTRTSLKLLKK